MASVWGQLKRRNVVRVAVAYAIAIWLILQLTDLLIPLLGLPERVGKPVLLLLVVEFSLETVGTTSLTVSLIVHRTAVRALQKRFEDIHIETEESVALIRFPQTSENV